jgi:hypothetical protein
MKYRMLSVLSVLSVLSTDQADQADQTEQRQSHVLTEALLGCGHSLALRSCSLAGGHLQGLVVTLSPSSLFASAHT